MSSSSNTSGKVHRIQISLDCVNPKLITGRPPFVFLSLYLHLMKPSDTINMFKISVILFVTLQQKNNWFFFQVGEDGRPREKASSPELEYEQRISYFNSVQADVAKRLRILAMLSQAQIPRGKFGPLYWGIICISRMCKPC